MQQVYSDVGILILTVAVLPAVCLWLNTESVMLLLQQDPCVAKYVDLGLCVKSCVIYDV